MTRIGSTSLAAPATATDIVPVGPLNTYLAECCLQKGLHADQIAKWRSAFVRANRGGGSAVSPGTLAEERRRNWALEKELDLAMPAADRATA